MTQQAMDCLPSIPLPRETLASLFRGMNAYRDKIGLDKEPHERTIAPGEIDFLESASDADFLGRFTPYAMANLKTDRVVETEKANAMAHFNWQAYMTANQGAAKAEELGELHELFEKGRPQEGVKSEEMPDTIADRINNALARVQVEAFRNEMPGVNDQVTLAAAHKAKLTFDAYREKVTSSPILTLEPFVREDFIDSLFQQDWEQGHLARARPHEADYIDRLDQEEFREQFIVPLANLWHNYGVSPLFKPEEMAALLEKDPEFPEIYGIPIDAMVRPDSEST